MTEPAKADRGASFKEKDELADGEEPTLGPQPLGLRGLFRRSFAEPQAASRNPPWFDARGIAVGLAVGLGLPIGTQMVCLGALRLIFRFNSLLAFAFTWVNNPITLIPMYYGYYCLGSMILGKAAILNLEAFRQTMKPIVDAGFFGEAVQEFLRLGWDTVTRIAVAGSIVGAAAGLLGYVVGYRVMKRRSITRACPRRSSR